MFIQVTPDFVVTLEDPQDFKHFKLVVAADRADLIELRRAIEGVASLTEDGHAWVNEDWLRRHGADATWQDGLSAMIEVAKKYGWVDEKAKTIRAHIEWADNSVPKS